AGSMLDAVDWNATRRPSAEITGLPACMFALAPAAPLARLTRGVVFVRRSRTYTCWPNWGEAGSRLEASETKATKGPSAGMAVVKGRALAAGPAAPVGRRAGGGRVV